MKRKIHITDTTLGLNGEFYLVSRAWMRGMSVLVAFIFAALVFFGYSLVAEHALALDSQRFSAADREMNQALAAAYVGRSVQLEDLHTHLCELIQERGRICQPLPPAIAHPERYPHVVKPDGSGFLDSPATRPTPTP